MNNRVADAYAKAVERFKDARRNAELPCPTCGAEMGFAAAYEKPFDGETRFKNLVEKGYRCPGCQAEHVTFYEDDDMRELLGRTRQAARSVKEKPTTARMTRLAELMGRTREAHRNVQQEMGLLSKDG